MLREDRSVIAATGAFYNWCDIVQSGGVHVYQFTPTWYIVKHGVGRQGCVATVRKDPASRVFSSVEPLVMSVIYRVFKLSVPLYLVMT